MVSDPDLSIELSMLHGDDGSISANSQDITRLDCTIRVFRLCVVLDDTQLYT